MSIPIILQISFDGQKYEPVKSSKFCHLQTGIANYKNQALTTGCAEAETGCAKDANECAVKTELFNMETLTWSDGPDFPFSE